MSVTTSPKAAAAAPARSPVSRGTWLLALTGVLAVLCLLSIMLGSRAIGAGTVLDALAGDGDAQTVAIVWDVRIPRTAMALLVAAGLGMAGVLMQALTRNPLADPGLLGVTAGAAFAIVISVAFFGIASMLGFIWTGFGGALVAGLVVYLLGGVGRGGATPVKLAVAGVAVSALLSALTSGIVLTDTNALNRYRYWAAGSLAGQDTEVLLQIAPFLLVGMVVALSLASSLNSLALGDRVAKSLGRRVGLIRLTGAVVVTLLTGACVAVCGPIVFVGLIVPHVARAITGPDYRWMLGYTLVLAPILMLAADITGRVIARPTEVNVGVVLAFIGGPFFIALVRRRRLAEL
ncbi:FecCD family ABC transporter permease [Stackebrandtia nassauensis]|uniref:Transport system permease protein n=1 Tax=Stackebrandtia nassauensis (strain DSM 44728 / CIP 108903 / NRRL B-16338 / NBRC 102104 / LLR-40K-21) TaxID=446470 RepID=D3PUU6_STANL|nr:iron chelate uptake ABC transporter family permease subunit [Stackebrandtia nassauensis]ADD44970.1 transport system permease protein [Stackebrandtia nassauensis DSM 44728]